MPLPISSALVLVILRFASRRPSEGVELQLRLIFSLYISTAVLLNDKGPRVRSLAQGVFLFL